MPDYKNMSIAELEAQLRAFNAERDAIKAEARALVVELDLKLVTLSAAQKVAAMSDEERQVLRARSIDSLESFGTIGAR